MAVLSRRFQLLRSTRSTGPHSSVVFWLSCVLACAHLRSAASMATSSSTSGEQCIVAADQGPCRCQLASNSALGLELTSLKTLFTTPQTGFDAHPYVWSPCGEELNFGEQCSVAFSSAACQGPRPETGQPWVSLGQQPTASFFVNTTGTSVITTLDYTGGTDGRSSTFNLVCDEPMNGTTFKFVGESPPLHYEFVITGNEVCLVAFHPAPSKQSISPGSIILIICVCAAAMYLIGGVIYQKVVRGANGVEMIPNHSLWMDVPALVGDGVSFVLSPCQSASKSSSKSTYQRLD